MATVKKTTKKSIAKERFWIVTPYGPLDEAYSSVVESRKAVIRMDRRLRHEWYSITKSETSPTIGVREQKKTFIGQIVKGPMGGFIWWEENGSEHYINRDGSLGRRL